MRNLINDYITKEEKEELWEEALNFANRKKKGEVLCRVLPFFDNDSEEETKRKLHQHAYWKYIGNIAQRLFINFITKEVGHFEHDVLYTTKKGHVGDIDTLTKDGKRGDIKASDKSFYMNVNQSDLRNNDIFIKIHIDPKNGIWTICGWQTKEYIQNNIQKHGILYRVEYKDLNKNIEELINMYR